MSAPTVVPTQIEGLPLLPTPSAVPTQPCSHPSHQAWWGTSPELPVTDFYHRSSKCKKCYIRQQQESKTRRITPSASGTGIDSPSGISLDSNTPLTSSAGITKSPYPNPPAPPASVTRLGPAPVAAARPLPTNFNMNQAISNNLGARSFSSMSTFNSPQVGSFPNPSQQFTPSLPLPTQQPYYAPPPPQQATTPFILSRPPREVNRKVLSATILKRLKPVLDQIRALENAWPFNQPVDPMALELDDYFEVIKKPMDLRTIDENLASGKYASETQLLEDVRLVWENAKTYNKVDSEIYDFAIELSEIFETNYKRIVKECEMQAKTEAEKEVRSDICAFCGFGVVIPAHQRPQQPPTPATPALPLQPQKVQTQTQQITFQPSLPSSQPSSSLPSSAPSPAPPGLPSSPPLPPSGAPAPSAQHGLPAFASTPVPVPAPGSASASAPAPAPAPASAPVVASAPGSASAPAIVRNTSAQPATPPVASPTLPAPIVTKVEETNASPTTPPLVPTPPSQPPTSPPLTPAPLSQPPNTPPLTPAPLSQPPNTPPLTSATPSYPPNTPPLTPAPLSHPPNTPPLTPAPLSQPPNSPPSSSLPPAPSLLQTPLRPPPPSMPTTPLTPKPLPLPLPPSLTSSGNLSLTSSTPLSSSSSLSSFPTAKPAAPVATPLLHCDGACLRAFHPHCLNLTEYSTPWLCNECRTGKPVLHWDPAKSEYFYYFYNAADAPLTEDEEHVEARSLGSLPRETKRKLREEEEDFRTRGDMYFDDMWCMWRCRSREVVQQRDDRQKQLLKKISTGNPER